SKMDDSKTVVFRLDAEESVKGWLESHVPTLILRCKEKSTDAYMVTGMAASVESGGDAHTVQVRFDDKPVDEQRWHDSTDDKALFAPNPVSFIKKVSTAKRLRIGFTPFNASPVIAEFDVTGFGSHMSELSETCHWK